jgi:hypothetical protein
MPNFEDDLAEPAEFGFGPEVIVRWAEVGMPEGALATFTALEPDRQHLVLRLLDDPGDPDLRELGELPGHENLSRWLLTLPPFNGPAIDDDED